jgi:hypothetical protein
MKTLLLVCLLFLDAGFARATEIARVFFPPHVAGGVLRLFPSGGVIVFTGNGWTDVEIGRTTLQLEWQDEKRPDRMVRAYWTFEMPPDVSR